MLSLFPRDVLDEILDLTESVSKCFPTYSFKRTPVHVTIFLNLGTEITSYGCMAAMLILMFEQSPYMLVAQIEHLLDMLSRHRPSYIEITFAHYASCLVLFCNFK